MRVLEHQLLSEVVEFLCLGCSNLTQYGLGPHPRFGQLCSSHHGTRDFQRGQPDSEILILRKRKIKPQNKSNSGLLTKNKMAVLEKDFLTFLKCISVLNGAGIEQREFMSAKKWDTESLTIFPVKIHSPCEPKK